MRAYSSIGLDSLSPTDREEILFRNEGALWRCWVCNLPAVGHGFTARRRISGRGSFFEQHKSCFDLPNSITNHTLHPHPLNLSPTPKPEPDNSAKKPLRCSLCRDVCGESAYSCVSCEFTLDVKCASLTETQCQRVQKREVKFNLLHFTHDHVVSLCSWREEFGLSCSVCGGKLSDGSLAYCCMKCNDDEFIVHESCATFPTTILHPYHEHPLSVPAKHSYKPNTSCYACGDEIYKIGYQCSTTTCRFRLHLKCASRPVEAINLDNLHNHDLFYFKANHLGQSFLPCGVCHNYCRGSVVYSCIKCPFRVESDCIPIPATIRHDHMHSLIYVEPVAEDYDSKQEFYCFACETERDPRLPFYNCAECPYAAHISCILAKDKKYCDGMFDKVQRQKRAEEDTALSDINLKLSRLASRIEKEKTETEATKAKLKILTTLLKQSEESKDN